MRLVKPSTVWKTQFQDLARDHGRVGEARYELALRDFDMFLQSLEADAVCRPDRPGWVPQSHFWLEDQGTIIGVLRLRHRLTAALERVGGHVGYAIRPSMRRQRYGTRLLALGLVEAKHRGINPILVTCEPDNIGSIKIIEANGGQLDADGPGPHRRYWIPVP